MSLVLIRNVFGSSVGVDKKFWFLQLPNDLQLHHVFRIISTCNIDNLSALSFNLLHLFHCRFQHCDCQCNISWFMLHGIRYKHRDERCSFVRLFFYNIWWRIINNLLVNIEQRGRWSVHYHHHSICYNIYRRSLIHRSKDLDSIVNLCLFLGLIGFDSWFCHFEYLLLNRSSISIVNIRCNDLKWCILFIDWYHLRGYCVPRS